MPQILVAALEEGRDALLHYRCLFLECFLSRWNKKRELSDRERTGPFRDIQGILGDIREDDAEKLFELPASAFGAVMKDWNAR